MSWGPYNSNSNSESGIPERVWRDEPRRDYADRRSRYGRDRNTSSGLNTGPSITLREVLGWFWGILIAVPVVLVAGWIYVYAIHQYIVVPAMTSYGEWCAKRRLEPLLTLGISLLVWLSGIIIPIELSSLKLAVAKKSWFRILVVAIGAAVLFPLGMLLCDVTGISRQVSLPWEK